MGIYSTLEDKWYDFLDQVNEKIPVYKIIDPIDNVVPSFILFIVLFVLLIILLILLVASPGIINQIDASVSVLSSTGVPLGGVKLIINSDCEVDPLIVTTGEYGKSSFKVCSQEFVVTAEKEGFTKSTKTLL